MTPSPPLILLAEDHAPTAEITQEIIATFGYEVRLAQNGLEAIALTRELRPALVLMDVQMPEVDGLEATRRLKEDAATRAIPVVCLTAFAMDEQAAHCRAAGAEDHLPKPLDFARLEATLHRFAPLSGGA